MAELHLERRCFWIYGDVQGVAYRAHAQAKARELGVAGYVQNCADGRVEIFDDPVIERWPQPFEIRR